MPSPADPGATGDDPVELARRIVAAWNEDDLESVIELIDPDVELYFPDTIAFPGMDNSYSGHEGLRKWWRDAKEPFEYWRSEYGEFVNEGEKVVVSVQFEAKGKSSGATVNMDIANYWVIRDGKLVRFEGHPSLESALAAAGMSG